MLHRFARYISGDDLALVVLTIAFIAFMAFIAFIVPEISDSVRGEGFYYVECPSGTYTVEQVVHFGIIDYYTLERERIFLPDEACVFIRLDE